MMSPVSRYHAPIYFYNIRTPSAEEIAGSAGMKGIGGAGRAMPLRETRHHHAANRGIRGTAKIASSDEAR
jgi:hypothetical protein